MGNYLTDRRKELELTMKQVAEAVGVSEGTVSRWESGAIANMKRDKIYALAKVLKTTPTFVMTGEIGDTITTVFPDNIIPMPATRKVPLLGMIACGEPILAVENVADYVDMDADIHADFALRCKGDSMINARIFDGDVVYIRKQSSVENGEIAAVLVNELEPEATLKRVYTSEDSIRLCAANPMYPDKIFEKEKMNDVTILGKAVAFLSSIK